MVELWTEVADESDIESEETEAGPGLGWTSPDCWRSTTVIQKAATNVNHRKPVVECYYYTFLIYF